MQWVYKSNVTYFLVQFIQFIIKNYIFFAQQITIFTIYQNILCSLFRLRNCDNHLHRLPFSVSV